MREGEGQLRDLLRIDSVCKHFGGVAALEDVSFSLRPGEVHALVGENGAGKSTLINIATGVLQPDSGELFVNGEPVEFHSPLDAAGAGIAVVHQEADLFPQLSIAENMLIGRGLIRGGGGFIHWRRVYDEAADIVDAMGDRFDVRAVAGGLPVGRRMIAEIAAAVQQNVRILFLDEPTASLTHNEAEKLFKQIRRLRDEGVGIVYVSHRLAEVFDLADRITVLRDGGLIECAPTADWTMDRVVAAMVGREVTLATREPGGGPQGTKPCLRVENLSTADGAVANVSIEAAAGEIVGVYGFVGAGRSEFGQALFGIRSMAEGNVILNGNPVSIASTQDAVSAGIAYVPEDRLVQGVFRSHSVRANSTIAILRKLARFGWIRHRDESERAAALMQSTDVRAASQELPMNALSGGNQQKVILARWLAADPRAIILDEPTRGVDVGAKAAIHKIIHERAAAGTAVVVLSSDLPEVMHISDRIYTMANGAITGEFDGESATEEEVATAAIPATATRGDEEPSRVRPITALIRAREAGLIGAIAMLSLLMAALRPAEFATIDNFLDIMANAALPAMMAIGALLVIGAGAIDISVGSMMGLAAALSAIAAKSGAHPALCLVIAVLAGCAMGGLNASAAILGRIHPIVVTLAGISIYRGVMRIVMNNREIMDLPPGYRAIANGEILGVPKIVVVLAIVMIAAHIFLRYRITGRRLLAIGDSESAARLIGLSKTKLYYIAFMLSGALVGLTAVLHTAYYGKVQANTGAGWELQAIAATVIGGTNIMGGRGTAFGTVLGACLVALLANALILANVSSYWQQFFVGALILIAVVGDSAIQRYSGRSA